MNSQENTNSATSASQVDLLSMEFKLTLKCRLEEKIASMEAEKKELLAANATWEDEMIAKCAKLKKLKSKIKTGEIDIKKLEKTRDEQYRVAKHLTDYTQLLKTDLKKSQEENIKEAKEQEKAIADMENEWKIYQAGYETLPLAIVRNQEKTTLQKAKIELLLNEQRLKEIKEIVKLREDITTKRSNNIIVECAEHCKKSKEENDKMSVAIAKRKILNETIRQQEKTLDELVNKKEERLAASQQLAKKKLNKITISMLPRLQKLLPPIPRFDLSSVEITQMNQPMPYTTLAKDFDTISITSSVIDDLIEQVNPLLKENTEHDGQEQEQNTKTGLGTTDDKEDREISATAKQPDPNASLRFKGMDEEEEAFEKFETTTEKLRNMEAESSPKAFEQAKAMDEESCDRIDEEIAELDYWKTSEARQEIPAQNCPSEIKHPRISKTEIVHLKLTPHETEGQLNLLRDDSLHGRDYNWKVDHPASSPFSYSESQRVGTADLESSLVSAMSNQSDDFMKEFHLMCSPEHVDREENIRSVDNNQTPSKTGAQQRSAPGLVDMGNPETPASSRGKRKGDFFLNLF